MWRRISAAVVLGCLPAAPAVAQQAGFGTELFKREAWTVRLDASAAPESTVVAPAGPDLTVTTKAAAIVWRPRDHATGNFTVRATVYLPAGSTGGAGVFFAGYDLEGMDRNFAACLVRADGSWSIPHRNGVELHDFQPWARSEAVRPAAGGESANVIEWVVADRVSCRINGQEVFGYQRPSRLVPGGLRTFGDGEVGVRVDAGMTARFAGFEVIPGGGATGQEGR